jgi:pimeloyl-ACP methyl ester carboxylesterase
LNEEQIQFFKSTVHDGDAALAALDVLTGSRLSRTWMERKLEHWYRVAARSACEAYLDMVISEDFSAELNGITTPFFVMVGKHDLGGINEVLMRETLMQWLPRAELAVFEGCGHYPVDEVPLFLIAQMETFMKKNAQRPASPVLD